MSAEQAVGGDVDFAGRSTRRALGRVGTALAGIVALGLASPADAADAQYRKVVLVDGRVLLTEVLSTEPTGLRMQVPQGETLIPFELLLDMTPITATVYQAQPDWVVYYAVDPELEDEIVELLSAMENIAPQPVAAYRPGDMVTGSMAGNAKNCQGKIRCIAAATSGLQDWLWVLTTEHAASGPVLRAKVNKSGEEPPTDAPIDDNPSRDELWEALHTVLGLQNPGPAPRTEIGTPQPEPKRRFDEGRVVALSFVPVPGVPSLAQRDSAGFALAMGVVIPSTALWIGAVGANGESMLETGALAVGGYYAVTVLANQVAGMRSMNKRQRIGVTAAPTVGGGAQVMVVGAER